MTLAAPFDLVLVIIDACRADRGPTTPEPVLAALAARAGAQGWVLFRRAYAPAPWTLPSCTTLLSGVPPWVHGRYTHRGPLPFPTFAQRLAPTHATAAFVNNTNLHPSSGMDAGFATYELLAGHDEPFAAATRWWAQAGRGPRFLVLHTNIVHDFYKPVALGYLERGGPETTVRPLGPNVVSWRGVDEAGVAAQERIYDACVRAVDERLDAFLELIDPDRTVVAVCSDHGEGLDPARGRVHHGGRFHEDLMGALLVVGIPTARRGATGAALEALAAAPFGLERLPALLAALAGAGGHPVDGTGAPTAGGLTPVSHCDAEDRRYLYIRNRMRLNVNRTGKNTSFGQRLQNRALQTVITDFAVAARVEGDHKLVATRFGLARPFRSRRGAERLLPAVLGRPVSLVPAGQGTWLALEAFDLAADPAEEHDLLLDVADPQAAALEVCPTLAEVPLAVGGRTWAPHPRPVPVTAAARPDPGRVAAGPRD